MSTPKKQIVITNNLFLDEIILTDNKTIDRHTYVVPDTMEAIQLSVPKAIRRKITVKSRTSKLSKSEFLASLFLHNEITACSQKVIDKEGMLRSMRREFPTWPARTSRNFFKRWAELRKKYNEGRLHEEQPLPPLYAWVWNLDGFIRHTRNIKQLLAFDFCKKHLIACRFGDPRFFTKKELEKLRQENLEDPSLDWNIPALGDIETLEKEIGKPLFDSLLFPSGYQRGQNY